MQDHAGRVDHGHEPGPGICRVCCRLAGLERLQAPEQLPRQRCRRSAGGPASERCPLRRRSPRGQGRAPPRDRARRGLSRRPWPRAAARRRLGVVAARSSARSPSWIANRLAMAGAHGSRTHRATPSAAPLVLKTREPTGTPPLPAHRSQRPPARIQRGAGRYQEGRAQRRLSRARATRPGRCGARRGPSSCASRDLPSTTRSPARPARRGPARPPSSAR